MRGGRGEGTLDNSPKAAGRRHHVGAAMSGGYVDGEGERWRRNAAGRKHRSGSPQKEPRRRSYPTPPPAQTLLRRQPQVINRAAPFRSASWSTEGTGSRRRWSLLRARRRPGSTAGCALAGGTWRSTLRHRCPQTAPSPGLPAGGCRAYRGHHWVITGNLSSPDSKSRAWLEDIPAPARLHPKGGLLLRWLNCKKAGGGSSGTRRWRTVFATPTR